jgi:hypothetical protein
MGQVFLWVFQFLHQYHSTNIPCSLNHPCLFSRTETWFHIFKQTWFQDSHIWCVFMTGTELDMCF